MHCCSGCWWLARSRACSDGSARQPANLPGFELTCWWGIGIGFLGSGVIFVSRSGESVLGLTTAGSIWATAAIGISAGLGYYILAVGATLILLVVLRGMARFDKE